MLKSRVFSLNKTYIYCFGALSDTLVEKFKRSLGPEEYETKALQFEESSKKSVDPQIIDKWRKLASFPLGVKDFDIKYNSNRSMPNSKLINYPRNSWYEAIFPFKTNESLRDRMRKFQTNDVRIGLTLDLLDNLSGLVAFTHCYNDLFNRNMIILTASVDHVQMFKPINVLEDLKINAYVTWVGKSSLEVRTDLYQNSRMSGSASFLMVARSLKDFSKKAEVPGLDFTGESELNKCKLRNELGEKNQIQRKNSIINSLEKEPPSVEEIKDLHQIFGYCGTAKEGQDFIYQEDTKIEKSILMHSQVKNIYGKIFGGHLMREAFEIGWLCAYMYSNGDYPAVKKIDDFVFYNPVEVGSAVKFEAIVAFAGDNIVHVRVDATTINVKNQKNKATVVHLTFECANTKFLPVYPHSYAEALKYFESKRKLNKILN